MNTMAVVLEQPEHLVLSQLALAEPSEEDIVVEVDYSGISTGTERLLWTGRMPTTSPRRFRSRDRSRWNAG